MEKEIMKFYVYLTTGAGISTIVEADSCTIEGTGTLVFYEGRSSIPSKAFAPGNWGGFERVSDERAAELIARDDERRKQEALLDNIDAERAHHWTLAKCEDDDHTKHAHLILHREDESIICEAALTVSQLESILEAANNGVPDNLATERMKTSH